MDRCYSVLQIKSFSEEERTLEGIATTASTDRVGDIVEPMGAVFNLPLPMLWMHAKGSIADPIGHITAARPTAAGIAIKGRMLKPGPDYPQQLRDDLNKSWVLVRDRAVTGLSIGFTPLEWEPVKGGSGVRYKRWAWLELSVVGIPANAEATIQTVKMADLLSRQAHRVVRLPKPGVVRLPDRLR